MSDYLARWLFIAGCALVGAAALAVLGVGVDFASARPRLEFVLLLLSLAAVLAPLAERRPRLGRPIEAAVDFSLSLAQLVAAIAVIAPLSYLAAAPAFPLVDAELARLDAALGFEWDGFARWVGERPVLGWLLQSAYDSLRYQPLAALLAGSVLRTGERNREVIWLTCLGLVLCIAISVFTPAMGMGERAGLAYAEALKEVRSGGWSAVDYDNFQGIVTFPSFHTASAVFLIYVVRRSPWLLWLSVPLNLAMIVATPLGGGHYLVDLLAGAAVAGVCILLVRRLEGRRSDAAAALVSPRPVVLVKERLSPG